MPRETEVSFKNGAAAHKLNVSPSGKVGPGVSLLGRWGNNKKSGLQLHSG